MNLGLGQPSKNIAIGGDRRVINEFVVLVQDRKFVEPCLRTVAIVDDRRAVTVLEPVDFLPVAVVTDVAASARSAPRCHHT